MRTIIRLLTIILSLIIVGEIVAYYLLLNKVDSIPATSLVPTPAVQVKSGAYPPVSIYAGTVGVFKPDTGPSGRYSYYLELIHSNGGISHFRFPKRDMDKISIRYYDNVGNLIKETNVLELSSILEGDIIEVTVNQHEVEPGSDKELYFNLIFDKIDVNITRETYE